MGNHDAFLLEPDLVEAYTNAPPIIDAVNWCREQLSRESFDYLSTFKPTADILATTPLEQLDVLLEERQATVMAGGHTHLQMLRQHRGSLVLNVGSVGMPFKKYVAGARPTILAHAEYAIVEETRGVVSVALYRVPIDKDALQISLAQTTNPLRDLLIQQYA